MPANLGPEYKTAEQSYREASTPEEQLEGLQGMLRAIPKHKGTEKMQADLKRRISKARKEIQKGKKKGATHKPFYNVDKFGAGQVVLVGPPNSGKSQLLAALTNASPDVADYPFTTQLPLPGMVAYQDVQIQLVDLPAIDRDVTEPWVLGIVRNADAVLLVVDASSDDVLADTDEILTLLEERNIHLVPPTAEEPLITADGHPLKRTLMVAAKVDNPRAEANYGILKEFLDDRLPLMPVSAQTGLNLDRLKADLFAALHVIRVYTRAPGKETGRGDPFVLKAGSTLLDAARTVHAELAENLKYARIWGSERFDGQMVSRDHVLEDEDLIEIHL